MIAQPDKVPNREELRRRIKRSLPTIRKYLLDGAPDRDEEGYSVSAWLKWMAENRREDDGEYSNEDLSRIAIRLKVAEAENKEEEAESRRLKNAKLRGELLDRDETVADHSERLSMARTILETIPDTVAKELAEVDRVRIRGVAKNIVDRALRIIASWQPPQGGEDGSA